MDSVFFFENFNQHCTINEWKSKEKYVHDSDWRERDMGSGSMNCIIEKVNYMYIYELRATLQTMHLTNENCW